MADRPDDVKYTKTHEWVRIEGDTATIGITDFAVSHLGDLVFVDLPDTGTEVDIGASMAEIESVKAVGEVYACAAGEVIETNEDLAGDQTPLQEDPYGAGWLVKLKITGDVSDDLMDLDAYEAQLASEDDPS